MMVRVGDLVHVMFLCVAVDCTAAEEGTGKAGAFFLLLCDCSGNVNVNDLVRNAEALAERRNRIGVKGIVELWVDGECGDGEVFLQPFAQDSECIGEKDAVLAAGDTDEDAVTVVDEFKLDDGTHEFAEIGLRDVDVHRIELLPLFFMTEIDTEDAAPEGDGEAMLCVALGEDVADCRGRVRVYLCMVQLPSQSICRDAGALLGEREKGDGLRRTVTCDG